MTDRARLCLLAAALLALLLAPRAYANPTQDVQAPILQSGTSDLLPFDDLERADFNKAHGVLVYRLSALEKRIETLTKQLARKDLPAPERTRNQDEVRRLGIQTTALRMRLTQELLTHGVDGALIAYMNHAPDGPGRIERYAYGLVLLLPDLGAKTRALFERIVPQVEGAYHAITAQKERTLLVLKQSKLDPAEALAVSQTFDRQLRVIDQRFWILVDVTLSRQQRVWIWQHLPGGLKRKSQPVEHLYQLGGLAATQAARLKAVLTEVEHESSPDQAALTRVGGLLRDTKLSGEERRRLTSERNAAYERLGALQRYARDTTRSILTEEQWHEYLSIPPRLSTNERSGNYNRVLQGFKPSAAQSGAMRALQHAMREQRRESHKRMAELQRQGADYGPDSPQTMSMGMEMMGARAQGAAAGRDYLGAVFSEVLTHDELTRWVLGHWGYKQ
jgi:hypothetical protein